jgi:hypothetical protein
MKLLRTGISFLLLCLLFGNCQLGTDIETLRLRVIKVVPGNNLSEKLDWLQINAQSNHEYTVEVNTDETIGYRKLSYAGRNNITIIIIGVGANRIINITTDGGTGPSAGGQNQNNSDNNSNLSSFYMDYGVTLVLDNNITLNGNVNTSDGAFIMKAGSGLTSGSVNVFYGTFTMNSGSTITSGGMVYVRNNGTFTMNGGEISGNTNSSGVVILENGTFTMNSGKISGNSQSSSNNNFNGGGVHIQQGTFTMNGGEISGNSISNSSYYSSLGGGVYVGDGTTFTMNGGKISGNNVSSLEPFNQSYGGGVFVNGTFKMTGGEISGNTVYSSSDYPSYGGGVYIVNSGTFTKTGGTIYGYDSDPANSNSVIDNSGAAANEQGHAVYASIDYIGIIKRKETTSGPSQNLSFNGSYGSFSGDWDDDFSGDPQYGGEVPGSSFAEKLQWLQVNAQNFTEYTIYIPGDQSIDPSNLSFNRLVTITLKGNRVSLSSNGSMFTVGNYVTLILDQVVLIGRDNNDAPLVRVNYGGTLIMNASTRIEGNHISSSYGNPHGGGVYVEGILIMNEGSDIRGNSVSGSYACGGGVYLRDRGTFTLNGGVIFGNTARGYRSGEYESGAYGGGVYIQGGTFTLNGGILNNEAVGEYAKGGGVYVDGNNYSDSSFTAGTFTMNGGSISDNTAKSTFDDSWNTAAGGGVYIGDGIFTMSGGEIRRNTVEGNLHPSGGGVYVKQAYFPSYGFDMGGIFNMTGGEIWQNISIADDFPTGGGVYVSGTFNKTGGTIHGYAEDADFGNIAKFFSGEAVTNRGHAVHAEFWNNTTNSWGDKVKDKTSGPDDNLSYTGITGRYSGNWDFSIP